MALANITNNILTDSGILVTNLTPTTRTLTINGTTYDLSADRSWTIATGVGGSGTTNYLPKFTGASTIGNSIISESGSVISIAGTLNIRPSAGTSLIDLLSAGAGSKNYQLTSQIIGVSNTGFAIRNVTDSRNELIIDGSGNLGLGVTPSAWASGGGNLQLKSGVNISWSGQDGYLAANQYYNGTNSIYISNGFATSYTQTNGSHQFYTAPSGTAGNAISFTQAMTLDASGNLLVGGTSDSYITSSRKVLGITGTSEALISFRASGTAMGYIFAYASAIDISAIGRDFTVSAGTSSPTERFRIAASTGAATFSSSVTASGGVRTTGANGYSDTDGSSTIWVSANWTAQQPGIIVTTNHPLMFYTNNTERMRITSGGDVGIGTSSPSYKLDVNGAIAGTGISALNTGTSAPNFYGSGQVVAAASSQSALYLDTTWNTTGNPDGIYLNVTNTASGASSKLLNLKVGSVSQFSVSKGGAIQTSDPTNGTAQPWKLGDARSGAISTDSYIIVSVNGVTYSIPALNGLP